MTRKEAFSGFTAAQPRVTGPYDDVVNNFLDVASLYVAQGDIFLVSTAAFTETKPYIALTIKLEDKENSTIGEDYVDKMDADAVEHISRFKAAGDAYAGQTVQADLSVYWIDPDGSKKMLEYKAEVVVENFSALEKLEVSAPRAKDGKRTNVLYGIIASSHTYDYEYRGNGRSGGKVKAMLPLAGYLEFGKEWHPTEIDYSQGNAPKLYMLLSSGGVVPYEKAFEPVFTIGTNRVEFKLPDDDWGAVIDVGRLGSSTVLDLYFSFTVKVKNDYYPRENYTARGTVVCKPVDGGDDPMVKIAQIEPIFLYWDCLDGEMQVSLYPEGSKAVSQLQPGDKVLDAEGKGRVVTLCLPGEASELVRVTTAAGTVLQLTACHAVKTHTGYVKAGDLTNCGYLLARQPGGGVAMEDIVSAETVPFTGTVYAVELEAGETLVCNGIIVADSKRSRPTNCQWPEEIIKARALLHEALAVTD